MRVPNDAEVKVGRSVQKRFVRILDDGYFSTSTKKVKNRRGSMAEVQMKQTVRGAFKKSHLASLLVEGLCLAATFK
jgi:hypothetical protein